MHMQFLNRICFSWLVKESIINKPADRNFITRSLHAALYRRPAKEAGTSSLCLSVIHRSLVDGRISKTCADRLKTPVS